MSSNSTLESDSNSEKEIDSFSSALRERNYFQELLEICAFILSLRFAMTIMLVNE